MKTLNSIFIATGLSLFLIGEALSQQCDPWLPLQKGNEFTHISYDKKDKQSSKAVSKVTEAKNSDDGSLEVQITGEAFDDKDKPLVTIDYLVKCKDGNLMVQMGSSFLNAAQMKDYQEMDITIEEDFLDLPSDPSVGSELEHGVMVVKVENNNFPIMTMEVAVTNRTVAAQESITTPAGTFDCIKITYNIETVMGKAIPIKIKGSGAEWYSLGTGIVRSESYDKKGKMIGYTLLTDFKN